MEQDYTNSGLYVVELLVWSKSDQIQVTEQSYT